jgi:hypothetical protein
MSALVAAVCLVLATVAVHVSGLYFASLRLHGIGANEFASHRRAFIVWVAVLLSLYIVTLHMVEVSIWAGFYRAVVGLDDWATAMYFSLGAYSTVGADQVVLPREWRVLKGVEAVLGALMFGLSAAFLFGVTVELDRRSRESV